MDIDILSLFPEYFNSPLNESILKRAQEKGFLNIRHVQIRDFAMDKHRKVDDRPYGGGPGMVLKPEPVIGALRSVRRATSHVIYLSAQGELLTAEKCRSLAKKEHLVLLCGHYEGVDERAIEEVHDQISIGNYVLTNGGLAALVVIDALARFIPGVLGDPESADADSFEVSREGLLDCPHYTRPQIFEGKEVPEVLQNGDHQKIAKWRWEMALKKTSQTRPDLYQRYREKLS